MLRRKERDYEARLDAARKEAEERVLKQYFTSIEASYTTARPNRRKIILGALETLVEKLSFDPDKARLVRLEAGLTQEDLAEEIVQNRVRQSEITVYENGRKIPADRRGIAQKYLHWLKEKGYNPYKL